MSGYNIVSWRGGTSLELYSWVSPEKLTKYCNKSTLDGEAGEQQPPRLFLTALEAGKSKVMVIEMLAFAVFSHQERERRAKRYSQTSVMPLIRPIAITKD